MDSDLTKGEQSRLAKLETRIETAVRGYVDAGDALKEIRDDPAKLYSDFGTFEQYCKKKWNFSRQRAHQLITAAEAHHNLSTMVDIPKLENERQARELADLTPEKQADVWSKACEAAEEKGKSQPTAADIKKAKAAVVTPPKEPKVPPMVEVEQDDTGREPDADRTKPDAVDKLIGQLSRAIDDFAEGRGKLNADLHKAILDDISTLKADWDAFKGAA